MKRAALLSVSDRTGLQTFATKLKELGFTLLTSGGTGKFLTENGIETLAIEKYTGQKEILDGRVKTLHPRIHAGILAKRDSAEHLKELEREEIFSIDVVAVNLYPFSQALASGTDKTIEQMIELIDVGGPTMIRAAAKNHSSVYAVIDPADYAETITALGGDEDVVSRALRRKLAVKVFTQTSNYDLQIAQYLSGRVDPIGEDHPIGGELSPVKGIVLSKGQPLRYGENPHQQAAFYVDVRKNELPWRQLQGKELSYNNLLDFDAAYSLVRQLPQARPAVVITKHLNPCGVASAPDLLTALTRARRSDPRSHFGGIIAFNQQVDEASASAVIDDFTEIVVAPSYSEAALKVFSARKNLRVIQVEFENNDPLEIRSVYGGVLIQQRDPGVSSVAAAELMTKRKLSQSEQEDLQLSWTICAAVKSNAITLVKDQMLLASGAGQMSRIDSLEVALQKAGVHKHDLKGAVAASDAFFPFTDCLEALAKVGVVAVIAPRGAKKDDEVVACAEKLGISFLFTNDRHFKH